MKEKKLFNPSANDTLENRSIIDGNTTNIIQLNNIKYKWARELYTLMMGNFWIPQKVSMLEDKNDYENLTEHERNAYDGILSFLVFLDSIQTNFVPKISEYVTAPEINLILTIQAFQEAIHSESYQYIIESILPKEKRDYIYDMWRDNNILFERNKYIAQIYQDFSDNPTKENFFKVLIADYLLEGLYFYNGFNFFYNLSSRNKMNCSADIIRYIQRDELSHVGLYRKIILDLSKENSDIFNKELIYKMFNDAVEQEIKWTNHIIGDNILGVTEKTTEQYTKYLANERLKSLGLEIIFEIDGILATHNPYKHLERIGDTSGDGDVKTNFFEATVTSYNQSSSVAGWDSLRNNLKNL